ncbi:hypothetical protein [Burkholderia sp. BCC1993]|uniref:hypothetical protein n=1 Tax=Burkholderia sp. BCC1993 TaxID=2817444 RepID=UPI002AB03B7E|nr:hypothetical protein [Burkholderia sp. BCC1993]
MTAIDDRRLDDFRRGFLVTLMRAFPRQFLLASPLSVSTSTAVNVDSGVCASRSHSGEVGRLTNGSGP